MSMTLQENYSSKITSLPQFFLKLKYLSVNTRRNSSHYKIPFLNVTVPVNV